ncbi:hypothetical protein SCLCIDRAFT_749333 [Scleroderma citrinum Foug A]|uniref:Uncharacterized protein n=1 Tax=Scleroderma citrinum Foug A TaxID=1036808 RepID=A0A0C3D444_9AGAM|nr:hypothetical protein SCLCIDRAFT_749333 [Scleroderma citrinum Foug A]
MQHAARTVSRSMWESHIVIISRRNRKLDEVVMNMNTIFLLFALSSGARGTCTSETCCAGEEVIPLRSFRHC